MLYRNHEIGARVEQALLARGVPCRLGKGRALLDDPVISQLVASLRIVLSPDSDLDAEALGRMVLPEEISIRLESQRGETFVDRLRAFANSNPAIAKNCWRLLYQIENLKGLRTTRTSLGDLINAVLAQGIGRYMNPLERRLEHLTDPHENATAVELADAISSVVADRGRILVGVAGGLEVAIVLLLRRTLPQTKVGYARATEPSAYDLLIDLAGNSATTPARVVSLASTVGICGTAVFKALQVIEARTHRKLLEEYVVFDTETTGKDIESCEVVELAAARVRYGVVVDRFQSLIHCHQPITPKATEIHGYTDADLHGNPEFPDVWLRFRSFIGDSVLVAHNGFYFDVPVLNRLAAESGGLSGFTLFDTLPLARQLPGTGSGSLENLAMLFGIPTGRSHHALDDCLCLAGVVESLMSEQLRLSRTTCGGTHIECVALCAAIETPSRQSKEDGELVEAGVWRLFGRHSTLLTNYEAELATHSISGPNIAEITSRLGGAAVFERVRKETDPEDRYAEAYTRFRSLADACSDLPLEEGVRKFLDTVALSRSDGAGADPERVNLLTFHATKGLEFSRVYILGVEDDSMPGWRALRDDLVDEIREARRLLYVAMTRAKDRLLLTRSATRGGRATGATRFLADLGVSFERP